jgi:hypothetical protein
VIIPAGIRYPPDTRWVWARVQNPTRGYSRGRVWVIPAGIVAGGYLPYPIRTRPIAIPNVYVDFLYPWVFYCVICYTHRVWWAHVCSLLHYTRYPIGNLLTYNMWVRIKGLMLSHAWACMILPFNAKYCWPRDKIMLVRWIYHASTNIICYFSIFQHWWSMRFQHSICWGLVLKCYELRTRQHKILNINALRPSKHYLHKDLMNFGRRSQV